MENRFTKVTFLYVTPVFVGTSLMAEVGWGHLKNQCLSWGISKDWYGPSIPPLNQEDCLITDSEHCEVRPWINVHRHVSNTLSVHRIVIGFSTAMRITGWVEKKFLNHPLVPLISKSICYISQDNWLKSLKHIPPFKKSELARLFISCFANSFCIGQTIERKNIKKDEISRCKKIKKR